MQLRVTFGSLKNKCVYWKINVVTNSTFLKFWKASKGGIICKNNKQNPLSPPKKKKKRKTENTRLT